MPRPKILIQPSFKVSRSNKITIHNNGVLVKIGSTNSFTTESKNYFALVESVLSEEISEIRKKAINDFVLSAKRKNYWDKIVGFYLPIWGNATANKYNLKDVLLKELNFNGTINHANGYIAGSGGAYVDSGINPSTDGLGDASALLAFNSLTNSSEDVVDMGIYASITQQMYIKARNSSGNAASAIYLHSSPASASTPSSLGFFSAHRDSLSSLELYKNATLIASTSNSGGTAVNSNIYFLSANSGGAASDASTRSYNFFCVGKAVTLISDFNSDVTSLLSKI